MPFTWLCNGKGWCSLVSRWVTSASLQKHIHVNQSYEREFSPLHAPADHCLCGDTDPCTFLDSQMETLSLKFEWALWTQYQYSLILWQQFKDPNQHIDIIKWHDYGSVSSKWALPLTVGFSSQGGGRAAVNLLTANNHPDWLLLGGRVSLCVRERARVFGKKKEKSPPLARGITCISFYAQKV